MKIIKYFAFAAASLLTLAGCSEKTEENITPGNEGSGEESTSLTFRADLQPFTGTESTVSISREWQAGDRIAVFCQNEGGSKFISYVSEKGDGIFKGSGSKNSRYWSVFPTSMVESFAPGSADDAPDTLRLHFPCEQKGYPDSFDPDATGAVCTSTDTTLSFKNVGGLIRFTLGGGSDIKNITLRTTDGCRFGGVAVITISADNKATVSSYVDRKSAYSIWLSPATSSTFENDKSYCFSVPAQKFPKGLKIIFKNTEGKEAIWLDTTPRTLEASSILDLGVIDVTQLVWEDVAVVEFLKESGKNLLWPFSNPSANPFPSGYKDSKQVNFMRKRTTMTLSGFGDFVIYPYYDTSAYSSPSAAIGKCYVAPTNHTGLRFGVCPGSYLEVPGREGKAIYKVTITAGTNGELTSGGAVVTSSLACPRIIDASGTVVEGGDASKGRLTKGAELTWRFNGANAMPYRIETTESGETCILEVRVFYRSSSDPITFAVQSVSMGRVSVNPDDLTSATLKGSFEAIPFFDQTQFSCGFEYRLVGASEWTSVTCETAAESFQTDVQDLSAGKDYECRAVVKTQDNSWYSDVAKFSTSIKEEAEDSSPDVTGTYNYGTLKTLGHPRILMRKGDFEALAAKVKDPASWPTLAKLNDLILSYAEAEAASNETITYTLDASNKRLLSVSRKVERILLYCSYAYRMTGREEFLSKAVETLNTVCGQFKDWHPSHYLDVGEMALGVSLAYDWLYYDLDYDTRVMVRKAISNYAINTALNNNSGINATTKTKNNWNSVCNGGLVAAALAAYPQDKANCAKVIENALSANATAVESMYSPDGNYGEGYGYWGYGTAYQVCLLQMLLKAFGNDNGLSAINGFMKTGEYMLFMGSPCGGNFSYADGGSSRESMQIPMWWFAAKTGNSALVANEVRLLNNGRYSEDRLLPVIPGMIMDFSFDPSNLAFPSSNLWTGNGLVPVAMIHTEWQFNEADNYVGFKGGAANANHGHMDAGSFVYESQGVRWSDDLVRPDYATIENLTAAAGGSYWSMAQTSLRWDIFRMNNIGHSTLSFSNFDGSFNKLHTTDHNVSGKATMTDVYNDAGSLGARMDLTDVFKGQAKSVFRTIRLEGDDLVITDEVTALESADAKMMWRMLTPSTVNTGSSYQTLSQKGKTLYLSAKSTSASVTYTTWSAERPSDWTKRTGWDAANTGYIIAGYTATIPKGTSVTFTTTLSSTKPNN